MGKAPTTAQASSAATFTNVHERQKKQKRTIFCQRYYPQKSGITHICCYLFLFFLVELLQCLRTRALNAAQTLGKLRHGVVQRLLQLELERALLRRLLYGSGSFAGCGIVEGFTD